MRKSLIAAAILLCLSIALLPVGTAIVSANEEKVQMQQITSYGDESALKDVVVSMSVAFRQTPLLEYGLLSKRSGENQHHIRFFYFQPGECGRRGPPPVHGLSDQLRFQYHGQCRL